MIRILHTADWHIGQTLRGFSREHEHRKVFERLEQIVVERDVDALVIAGDVFDSQNPSGEAQQLFWAECTGVRCSKDNARRRSPSRLSRTEPLGCVSAFGFDPSRESTYLWPG